MVMGDTHNTIGGEWNPTILGKTQVSYQVGFSISILYDYISIISIIYPVGTSAWLTTRHWWDCRDVCPGDLQCNDECMWEGNAVAIRTVPAARVAKKNQARPHCNQLQRYPNVLGDQQSIIYQKIHSLVQEQYWYTGCLWGKPFAAVAQVTGNSPGASAKFSNQFLPADRNDQNAGNTKNDGRDGINMK